jgi:tight adherence protein C
VNPFMIILGLTFISVAFLIVAVFYNVEYQRGQWLFKRRMEKYETQIQQVEKTIVENFFTKMLESLGKINKPKAQEMSSLQKTFLRAGFRRDISMSFFGSKVALALLLPMIFSITRMFAFKTMPTTQYAITVLILAMIGFYIPGVWIKGRISRRRDHIFKGFPNALDLMVVCVEAGTSLDAAIAKVGEEMTLGSKVLSDEFKLLSLELRAGKSRKEALQNLALRCDLDDVNSLVTLLIQTDKFGTSIAQALRVYSDSMRTTRQQRAEEQAAKLPVKMIFPMVLFLFPSLFVVVVGPGAMKIFSALGSIVPK